jgi:hypothetical protein
MMPYVSNADRERALWMTLREAVVHIATAEHCSIRIAWAQLRDAIGDHEVLVRWANVSLDLSTIDEGRYIEEDDVPSNDKHFWKSARAIFTGGGSVLDDPAHRWKDDRLKLIREGTLRYRPMLVRREAVERLWPRLDEGAEASPPTDQIRDTEDSSGVSDNEVVSRAIDRKDVDEKVRQLIRELHAEHAHAIPNVNETWDLLKEKLPSGVTRKRLFVFLNEPEFDKRVPRGKRKRKK